MSKGKTSKVKGKGGRKPMTDYQRETRHKESYYGRRIASIRQSATEYKPRKNKSGNRSVMVGKKYGTRQGLDYYGKGGAERVYISKYRGDKVGYLDDVPRGDY